MRKKNLVAYFKRRNLFHRANWFLMGAKAHQKFKIRIKFEFEISRNSKIGIHNKGWLGWTGQTDRHKTHFCNLFRFQFFFSLLLLLSYVCFSYPKRKDNKISISFLFFCIPLCGVIVSPNYNSLFEILSFCFAVLERENQNFFILYTLFGARTQHASCILYTNTYARTHA